MGLALQKPLNKVVKDSLNESALKNALLFETFTGLETIKVQAAEGHTQRNWEELNEKASLTNVKMRHISSLSLNWATFVQQMVSVWIVIVGVYLIAAGNLTMGGLIACVLLSGRAMAPLSQVAGLLTRLNQSRESLKHLDELMKKPVERPAGKAKRRRPDRQVRRQSLLPAIAIGQAIGAAEVADIGQRQSQVFKAAALAIGERLDHPIAPWPLRPRQWQRR